MPKVTYHEYRPGRWVKIVDGEAVGPATAEEVARWQEEKAEQAKIWQDVVHGTAPASPPERSAEGAPKGGAARVDEVGIWQDVVSQTVEPPKVSTGSRADRKTEPSPPRTVEEAVRSARRGRPVSVKGGKVVAPDEGQRPGKSRATPTPTPEAAVTPAAPAEPAQKLAEPTRKRMTPERKTPRSEPVPKSEARPDRKPKGEDIDTLTKPVVREGEAPPTKIRRRKRKEAEVGGGAASVEAASPAEGARVAKPEPKRKRAKTTRPGEAVQVEAAPVMEVPQVDEPPIGKAALAEGQPAAEPLPTPEAPSIGEAAKKRPRQPSKVSREAAKADAVLAPESLSAGETAVGSPQPKRAAQVIPAPKSTMSRPPSAPQRRRKPSASTPQARLKPAYLWVMADARDDVAAAVRTGLARYEERFGEPAGVVLCHLDDLPIVEAAGLPVEAREGKSVLPRNFWIGPK
jgi:hypothetical protein